jgi:hypothetical protein
MRHSKYDVTAALSVLALSTTIIRYRLIEPRDEDPDMPDQTAEQSSKTTHSDQIRDEYRKKAADAIKRTFDKGCKIGLICKNKFDTKSVLAIGNDANCDIEYVSASILLGNMLAIIRHALAHGNIAFHPEGLLESGRQIERIAFVCRSTSADWTDDNGKIKLDNATSSKYAFACLTADALHCLVEEWNDIVVKIYDPIVDIIRSNSLKDALRHTEPD